MLPLMNYNLILPPRAFRIYRAQESQFEPARFGETETDTCPSPGWME